MARSILHSSLANHLRTIFLLLLLLLYPPFGDVLPHWMQAGLPVAGCGLNCSPSAQGPRA